MQCTRLPATQGEDQRGEIITTQTATVIEGPVGDAMEQCHGQEMQRQFTELESDHETVRLIPDCLEHIFKYLSTTDKGRVAQVRWLCSFRNHWTILLYI